MSVQDRTRCFALILYKDSQDYDYNQVIDYISTNYLKFAYIEHKPEEEETKEHTHVLLYFDNKRTITAISKELGISSNYIQCAKLKPYLRYLIHYDNEEKIQYSIDEVKGTLRDLLIDMISNNSEEDNFYDIYVFIQTFEGRLSFTELTDFCMRKHFYSTYRRNINALRILVNEHNNVY